MFNSARKGCLVCEQDLGAEEGFGEARCCARDRILPGSPGPGSPKLSSPGVGTFLVPAGARAWVGGTIVLQLTRITPKEKRDSSQIGVLGTPAPAHSGASWHLWAASAPSLLGDPNLSRWKLRALGGSDSPVSSALGRPGKELGRQRPSAPRTRQEHPGSRLPNRVPRWLSG